MPMIDIYEFKNRVMF